MEAQPVKDIPESTSATSDGATHLPVLSWAHKYRGATVADLELPPALSTSPRASVSSALLSAYERDYTHLTVVADQNRALLGYVSAPRLKEMLKEGNVTEDDAVEKAMMTFRRQGRKYSIITTETELEDLEAFFNGGPNGKRPQDFAVVTDDGRKFVLAVVTRSDLEEFVKRRPG